MTMRLEVDDIVAMRALPGMRILREHSLIIHAIDKKGYSSDIRLSTDDPVLGAFFSRLSREINAAMSDASKARETAKIEERAAERVDQHVADCFAAQRTKRNELTAEECAKRAAAAQAFPFLHPGPTLSGASSHAGLAPSPSTPGAAGPPYPNCHMPGLCIMRGICLKDPNCAE